MGEQMRLKDATPGAVLRDPDGDLWTRTPEGASAACRNANDVVTVVEWAADDFDEAEGEFGPFVLIGWAPGTCAA